jgi:toxin ParE1/3/4
MTTSKAYRLTKAAARDLAAIRVESRRLFGLTQSDHYIDGLNWLFDILAENPELGRLRTDIEPPVRVHPHKSHVVLYTLDESRRPLIIRIRHAHEAWQDPIDLSHA